MSGFFAAGRWWDVSQDDAALVASGAEQLAGAGIPESLNEARMLYGAARKKSANDAQGALSDNFAQTYMALINRRAAREPFSHLVGYRDFYKYRFRVGPAVLDPRPETELLVEQALSVSFDSVLDLGVGSGCILLSLLKDRPNAQGVGVDLSSDALSIAKDNAALLDVDARLRLLCSDWFANVTGTFDLIVSNPPYIAADEMAGLAPEVRNFEPRMALTDEGDGLQFYRRIIAGASAHLHAGGHVMVEIGPIQAAAVSLMMADAGFADIAVLQDLDGRDRVVQCQKPPK